MLKIKDNIGSLIKEGVDDDYYWDIKQHPSFCGESLNGSCKNSPLDIIKKIEKENNMTAYEKIKQWAKNNEYRFETAFNKTVVILSKREFVKTDDVEKRMHIHLEYNTYKLLSIESYIVHDCITHTPQELENLFIPLNNIKRDEKLLKEYLKND